ncbi:protein of unknown function DUF4283 - like 10 [Theobroma cacao]|nr:protein of unknown function DUF4283 - like 10 [Theobroma cacao]
MGAEDSLAKKTTPFLLDDRSRKKVPLREEDAADLGKKLVITMHNNPSFRDALMNSARYSLLSKGDLFFDEDMVLERIDLFENEAKNEEDLEDDKGDLWEETVDGFPALEISDKKYDELVKRWSRVIQGSYLLVQPWAPNYVKGTNNLTAVAAWVRFPGMLLHLYHKSALRRLASLLGCLLKIDCNTYSKNREKFARITVELDLTKPLVPLVYVKGRRQKVEYEGLLRICYTCGMYGHVKEECHRKEATRSANTNEKGQTDEQQQVASLYGPWMLVSRKKPRGYDERNRMASMANNHVKDGSRFTILQHEPNDESTMQVDTQETDMIVGKDRIGHTTMNEIITSRKADMEVHKKHYDRHCDGTAQ